MTKKVYQLHDKHSEEITFTVIIDDTESDDLWAAWMNFNNMHNSETEEPKDVYEFVEYAKENGVPSCEDIEIDFIQH